MQGSSVWGEKQCVTAPNPKHLNLQMKSRSAHHSKKEYWVCVRRHADIVQHFATCATKWLGGSRDVRMGVGVRDDWKTGRGEQCGSP